MFDNVLYQNAASLVRQDVLNNVLPSALLFSGENASAKLTTALELARVLSCKKNGEWTCTCPECILHKSLSHPDLLLMGQRSCMLEIFASLNTFLSACASNAAYVQAARYLFIRAVRKLTARFNPVLWQEDSNASKIAPLIGAIDEQLELISPPRDLPDNAEVEKICKSAAETCVKLEETFLYDSLPIAQVRRTSNWAHLTTRGSKKTIIVENAHRMQDSARNAFLKILEESPEQTIFILTATQRTSVIPTILSRVRPYAFNQRSTEQQQEVISRVFHVESTAYPKIDTYLNTFLPIPQEKIKEIAKTFVIEVQKGNLGICKKTAVEAKNFNPRLIFRLFLYEVAQILKSQLLTQNPHVLQKNAALLRKSQEQVGIYNQNPQAALELLAAELVAF